MFPVTRSGSDFANNCGGPDYRFARDGGGGGSEYFSTSLFKKVVFFDIFAVPSAPLYLPTDTARLYAAGIHLWMLQPKMKQPSHNQWTLFGGGWSGVWV